VRGEKLGHARMPSGARQPLSQGPRSRSKIRARVHTFAIFFFAEFPIKSKFSIIFGCKMQHLQSNIDSITFAISFVFVKIYLFQDEETNQSIVLHCFSVD
jgi:hypothetical protein